MAVSIKDFAVEDQEVGDCWRLAVQGSGLIVAAVDTGRLMRASESAKAKGAA